MSLLAAACVSVTMSFAVPLSSPAFTVTVWAVLQFRLVNVNVPDDGLTVTSLPEWPATVTVTSAVGWVSRTTV